MKIRVERNPSPERLTALRVEDWPIWSKEVSTFPWSYNSTETCYILEGEVIVTPEGGESVQISKGDLVTFPVGMACTWDIRHPVKKHYQFD
ncbi:MAG: cupin domain-containing protein [bacterium]|uniref:Cupin domain-containing protein n=1 Tax=Candidatus Methylomirabilis tolerans TaxID=3123416 RepID=A0AAJ1AKF9_9BACT|nr:cupin domain-containing protein [Candidatus Methylomirabilis sp.]